MNCSTREEKEKEKEKETVEEIEEEEKNTNLGGEKQRTYLVPGCVLRRSIVS